MDRRKRLCLIVPALLFLAAAANPGVMHGVPDTSGEGLTIVKDTRGASGLPDVLDVEFAKKAEGVAEPDDTPDTLDETLFSWLHTYVSTGMGEGGSCHFSDATTAGGIWVPTPPAEEMGMKGITLPSGNPPKLDVLFCLDTTGSMGDEIWVAKATILDIAEAVADGDPVPEVRYALVIYRDLGDVYVTKVYDFISIEELAEILDGVDANGGGDYKESVSEALHKSVHQPSWDEDAVKAIYLIGDAPPHNDYDNGFDHIKAAQAAAKKDITINAIGCSGIQGNEAEFNEVVSITGGSFVYLEYGEGGSGYYRGGSVYDDEGDYNCSYVPPAYYDGDGCAEVLLCCCDSSSGGSKGSNNLDYVLTNLIQAQANEAGVVYKEDTDEG
jgi:hypothetical protein